MMRTFVLGDIHGAYKALLQCFKKSGFDYTNDHLIALGDVCDGWPEVHLVIDELLKVKNLTYIVGNHDLWALDWALHGAREDIWIDQGGENTLRSYGGPMPQAHADFLNRAQWYHKLHNRLFVHGGFDPALRMEEQNRETLIWDRELIKFAFNMTRTEPQYRISAYDEIFVGHTPTTTFGASKPLHLCNLWALDTGAGWVGPLTMMNVETKEFWQSDPVPELYRGIRGRKN